jgi:tetratricopeptide (TPR) repeat protein
MPQRTDAAALIRQFESAGNPWPGNPRREAVFALELLEPAVFSTTSVTQGSAQRLLDRVKRWVHQPLEPDDFEREWFYAALTLLQGPIRPGDLESYFNFAVHRFPNDPRFLLLRAINTEQRAVSAPRASVLQAPGTPRQVTVDLARQQYEAAIAFPQTVAEARVRLGWLLHRSGQSEEGLAQLDAAEALTGNDPVLRYLQQLLAGNVLVALSRPGDAISKFGKAMEAIPAQSARVALMNSFTLTGQREGAVALSRSIQADQRQVADPWWTYWQGLYRRYPEALARVREMAR